MIRSLFCLIALSLFGLEHASVGIYAIRMSSGEVILDQNSDLSLMPASCIKVITTAAALHLLKEDHHFETVLQFDGANVIIKGGGDPCLGSDRTYGWQRQIALWADAIEKAGIRQVASVMGDASLWEKAQAVPSWTWEDLGNYYGAGASALSFHENSYSLVFCPTQVGEEAAILRTDPPVEIALQNEVKTGPVGSGDQACIYGSEFSAVQFVRGTVPAGVNEFAIKGMVPDPAKYCAELLLQELKRRGIALGGVGQQKTPRVLHTTHSPTVAEIIHWTNQHSINLYAEHLLKEMGGGTTVSGVRTVTEFWRSKGIDLRGFNMVDGSGLSRKNLVTAKQFVQILVQMKDNQIFCNSLCEKGGIRGKSGTMSLVKCYVGYKGDIAFAILINQCPDSRAMDQKIKSILNNLPTL